MLSARHVLPNRILRSFAPYASSASYQLVPLDPSMADNKDATVSIDNGDPTDHRHAINADPEFENLTLYEKKALIVNRELNSHGMGRYQWYIFFLCGFGYFIDLLYAQVGRTLASRALVENRMLTAPAGLWLH